MSSIHQTFQNDGHTYLWGGGFGAIIKSYERGVRRGDVRMIDHELFYCYMVCPRGWFRKPEVWWTQPGIGVDTMRELHRKFFGEGA